MMRLNKPAILVSAAILGRRGVGAIPSNVNDDDSIGNKHDDCVSKMKRVL